MPEEIRIAIAWAIVIFTGGLVATAFTLARRWRSAASHASPPPSGELAELREAVSRMSGDLAELQERLDFAERLLAKQREAGRLGGGS